MKEATQLSKIAIFQNHLFDRYDNRLFTLMKWYEGLFGDNFWEHLVIEASFWKHSKDDSSRRQSFREVSMYLFLHLNL